jgi:hypothetical protein
MNPKSGGEHRHLDEHELFEAAVSREFVVDGSAPCRACAARVEELRAGLARLRQLADVETDRRGAALVERVLAHTVHSPFESGALVEPNSWRGDARLVLSFARERLRASMWLRVAAALLAIHVGALPVLAWIVLRAERPTPHFFSRIEPLPRESNFAEPDQAPLPLESSNSELEPGLVEVQPGPARSVERGAEDRWAAVRREQARGLRAFAWPAATLENRPVDALGQRLWARARHAVHGEAPKAFDEDASPGVARQDLLALELELALDRVALGDPSANASALVERLSTSAASESEPVRPLVRFALARAARLGLEVDLEPGGASDATALLGAAWFDALRAAAAADSAADSRPYTRLWLQLESR